MQQIQEGRCQWEWQPVFAAKAISMVATTVEEHRTRLKFLFAFLHDIPFLLASFGKRSQSPLFPSPRTHEKH